MISLFHGDHISQSRESFLQKKTAQTDSISLRGGEFSLTDLLQILEGGSLFSEAKHIFIEDLLLKVKKTEELTSIADTLTKHGGEHEIVLWEGKQLTPKQLKLFPGATVQLFKLPSTLFSFLDALSPKDIPSLLRLSPIVMADTGEEILFAMLVRHIRILLALKQGAGIDEIKRLAPWQRNKLERQATRFTTDQLRSLHHGLFTIDRNRKTGNLTTSLAASIDFLLLRLYH